MKQSTLDFLEKHKSATPSSFQHNAEERQKNQAWLKWSQGIAMGLIDYMQEHNLSRAEMADKLGVSPQYVSRLISGTINFSFKSLADLDEKLGIHCLSYTF